MWPMLADLDDKTATVLIICCEYIETERERAIYIYIYIFIFIFIFIFIYII